MQAHRQGLWARKLNETVNLLCNLLNEKLKVEKQAYTFDEALKASLEYFGGDELAARVWVNKYAMKDSYGTIYEKSPEHMHWRIANEIARVESK